MAETMLWCILDSRLAWVLQNLGCTPALAFASCVRESWMFAIFVVRKGISRLGCSC